MASMALGIAGSLIPIPGMGLVGAAIGSYLDQRYIFPAIFGDEQDQSEGPKADMLGVTSGDPGAPMNRCYGPRCVVPAQVIALGKVDEVFSPNMLTGKGGGGERPEAPRSWYFFQTVAYAYNEGRTIQQLDMMKLDGKVAYAKDYTVTETSEHSTIYSVTGGPPWGCLLVVPYEVPMQQFVPGYDFTMSGWASGNNNKTFKLTKIEYGTHPIYFWDAWICHLWHLSNQPVPETLLTTMTMTQTIDDFKPNLMESFIESLGSPLQDNNPHLDEIYGEDYNPAYRNIAFCTCKRLVLHDFGNRLPNAIMQLQADASLTSQAFFEDVLGDAGLTASQYDCSGVDGDCLGYVVRGPTAPAKSLQPMMIKDDVTTQEADGKIKFFSRDNADQVDLNSEHLGAVLHGDTPGPRISIADIETTTLPKEVHVKFTDYHYKLEAGDAQAIHPFPGTSQDIKNYNLTNITMSHAEAESLAERLLNVERFTRPVQFTLPGHYFWLHEGDVVKFKYPKDTGKQYYVLITKRERGTNWLLNFEGLTWWPGFQYEWVDNQPDVQSSSSGSPPTLDYKIVDIAPLADEHVQEMGFYVVASSLGHDSKWAGASIYYSDDDDAYEHAGSLSQRSYYGQCVSALGGGVTGAYIDRVNTITVDMLHGELESVTEAELYAGMNRAILGDEVIGFQTATSVGVAAAQKRYTLSNLLRGLRNTEDEIDNHATKEYFFFLHKGAVHFQPLNLRWHNRTTYLKVVPADRDEADYTGVQHTFIGGTIRPFGPGLVRGSRDASNNVTITWVRRSRAVTRIFGAAASPRIEGDRTRFEIDIYDGADVVRTIEVTNSETTTYTAAQQTTDGLTPGDPVVLKIYETSPVVGRGKETSETV